MSKVTQGQLNIHNLITKNTPADLMTVNIDEVTKAARKIVDAVDAENAKRNPPEDNWRQELDELDRRLANQMTVEEAKLYSDGQADNHDKVVRQLENEIKHLKDLLLTPGLRQCVPLREGRNPVSGDTCDVCLFNRKLEAVTLKLQRANSEQQKSIRVCGGIIADAKTLEPLRPRWIELQKRARKIVGARQNIRGLSNHGGMELEPTPSQRGKQLLTWEK
jgi:DNA repair exonuclease SbcCD ATPase subunit